jgi:hypothetical protein
MSYQLSAAGAKALHPTVCSLLAMKACEICGLTPVQRILRGGVSEGRTKKLVIPVCYRFMWLTHTKNDAMIARGILYKSENGGAK